MSDDIVKKLRERTDYSTMLLCDPPRPAPDRLCHDAADEIERLRKRVNDRIGPEAFMDIECRVAELEARIAALEETAVSAAKACFWSNVGGGRVVSRQASPDEVEAAIRAALAKGE